MDKTSSLKESQENVEESMNKIRIEFPIEDNISVWTKEELGEEGEPEKDIVSASNTREDSMRFINNGKAGRWSTIEHYRFLHGCLIYGKNWNKVKEFVKTRSSTQIRSHAQKFLFKLCKKFKYKALKSEGRCRIDKPLKEVIIEEHLNFNPSQLKELFLLASILLSEKGKSPKLNEEDYSKFSEETVIELIEEAMIIIFKSTTNRNFVELEKSTLLSKEKNYKRRKNYLNGDLQANRKKVSNPMLDILNNPEVISNISKLDIKTLEDCIHLISEANKLSNNIPDGTEIKKNLSPEKLLGKARKEETTAADKSSLGMREVQLSHIPLLNNEELRIKESQEVSNKVVLPPTYFSNLANYELYKDLLVSTISLNKLVELNQDFGVSTLTGLNANNGDSHPQCKIKVQDTDSNHLVKSNPVVNNVGTGKK